MKRSRFTEEQIIGILKEHQAGLGAKELCRKHGLSDATFFKWRAKFGGMEVSDAKKLKGLEAENAKLKKLLAEQMMDVSTLKEMLGKTSEACCAAACRGLCHDTEGIPSAAGLRFGRDRSACPSATADPIGRC
ncbi:Mobile element protein [Sulfitobacter noctilucae]|nr:Mobile element protein [Sulfitobacter noctilucae]